MAIIICTIIFIIAAVVFEVFVLESLPAQILGVLLGVVITAIITVLLLQGQTKSEESRERHVLVFEKKQEVFYQFLQKLNEILQNQNLSLHLKGSKSVENEVHNLQDLLFEFGFLQMHTSADTFDKILLHVGNLLEERKLLTPSTMQETEQWAQYYNVLSEDFFAIVGLLRQELYEVALISIDRERLERIIKMSF